MQTNLPSGTVTFLFTDIEGSTQLWERHPQAMKAALAQHDRLLREAIESHNGHVVKTTGDGCHAAFAFAADALEAIVQAQRALEAESWTAIAPDSLHIRAGLHSGETELRDGDYYGSAVNRAARIMSIGHGGQVLLSGLTAALLEGHLPEGVTLRELGEHRLRDLSRPEQIAQVIIDGLRSDFPPLKSLDAFPGNLPVQLTTFVGRERELAEAAQLLKTTRLLTLTGPGGTGKTRLSLQVAASIQSDYDHGVWLAELAPLADPALVTAAVAGLFGLTPQPGLPLAAVLTDYLRGKQLLLILDNCEHLVEACARLSADLLPVCLRLTILASSREGLGVPGETTYHVPTLALPSMDDTTAAAVCRYDATDLFLQRARSIQPNFDVTDDNATAIAQIVRRLDGIPLAIELAAARVRMLSPEQISARLDDRFRLLTGGSRTALPRQQTLRALIDWSYTLLSPQEAALFRRLGVFVGGSTLEAAEEVAVGKSQVAGDESEVKQGDILDLLAGLVNKSLVIVDVDEGSTASDSTEPRYRYLETIRQYARDKLFESGEGEAARDRHMAFFDEALARLGLVWLDGNVGRFSMTAVVHVAGWVQALDRDVENLRAAIQWATQRDPEKALLMATSFSIAMISARRLTDDVSVVQESLTAVEALPEAQGDAAVRRGQVCILGYMALGNHTLGLGNMTGACAHYGEAVRLARESGNRGLLARALVQRALASGFLNDESAVTDGEEAAALYRELGEPLGVAQALGQTARFYLFRGDVAHATPLAQESIAAVRGSNSPYATAVNFLIYPMLAEFLGDIATAEAQYRAGMVEFTRLENRGFATIMQSDLAHLLRRTGRQSEALTVYREAIRGWQDLGRRAAIANMLENFAFIARVEDQLERAANLFGAAEAMREGIQIDMSPFERVEYEREVAALREALPADQLSAEWAAGRALDLDAAVNLAVDTGTRTSALRVDPLPREDVEC